MKLHLLAAAATTALLAAGGLAAAQDNPDRDRTHQTQTNQDQSQDQGPQQGADQRNPDQGTQDQRDMGQDRDMQQGRSSDQDGTHGTGMHTTTRTLTHTQKTVIRTRIIERPDAPRVTNVNFTVRVGIAVPRTVRVVPVPEEIVTIYPQWAGYNYFIDGDEIVIVDPMTFAIVGTFWA